MFSAALNINILCSLVVLANSLVDLLLDHYCSGASRASRAASMEARVNLGKFVGPYHILIHKMVNENLISTCECSMGVLISI